MKKSNHYHYFVSLLLFCIGLVLILLSITIPIEIPEKFLESIGIGLITGGITYSILKYLFSESKKEIVFYSDFCCLGSKKDANSLTEEYFVDAEFAIDALGLSLANLFHGKINPNNIVKKIKAGCDIRFLILNPKSSFLIARANEEGMDKDVHISNYRHTIEFIEDVSSKLTQDKRNWDEYKGSIEIHLYDALPYSSYFRADHHIIAGLYNRFKSCNTGAAFEIRSESKFFKEFSDDFNLLFGRWNHQKPVLQFRGGGSKTFLYNPFTPPLPKSLE